MKRVILDTNIYGLIVEKDYVEELEELIEKRHDIIIYGFDVVRQELRKVSKEITHGKKKVRIIILGLYDRFVKARIYYTTKLIRELAEDYYNTYRHIGGKRSKEEMMNDFLIIACASVHELDVVVSEDNKTLFNEISVKAYKIVNDLKKYRTPEFISYERFRRLFS